MNINITNGITRIALTQHETNGLRKAANTMLAVAKVCDEETVEKVLSAVDILDATAKQYGPKPNGPQEVKE